jgi:murein DD-endopeptidase MepM/ murein hydrolase activator NlpD
VKGLLDRNSHFAGLHAHRAPARVAARNLPQVYRPHGKGSLPSLYLGDGSARRLISRLKWFISTCIVGAIGLVIIGVAMYTTNNIEDGSGIVESMQRKLREAMKPKTHNFIQETTARPGEKTDKIATTTKGLTTRYIIQDSVVERRDARDFIKQKPYTRIVASLSTAKPDNAEEVPNFNPFDIYVDSEHSRSTSSTATVQLISTSRNEFMTARVMEPVGGTLALEDGLELSDEEAERYVAEADAVYAESAAQLRPSIMPGTESTGMESGDATAASAPQHAPSNTAANGERTRSAPHTTIAEKNIEEDENNDDDGQVQFVIVKPNESLASILKTAGAEAWQAQNISDIFNKVQSFKLRAGQEVRMQLVPAANDPSQKEPVKISIFTGTRHEATVERNSDGDYGLTSEQLEAAKFGTGETEDESERSSLYVSLYSAMLRQDLDRDVITRLIKVLGYDVDFKQKVRPGDNMEMFFETKVEDDGAEKVGELLYVSMTVGGEQYKYYRYRTAEGFLDFYNDRGANARKFLLQVPVKTGRFTSGFGYRRHPLLGIRKMHTGVDWAAPIGTPIIAAGSGVIEEAGRHGGNGNYVRIRHSNGYKSAYSHMHKFGPGIVKGIKVQQGQVIGYVGTTGFSTGPHLHYEVLVNNRFTNPQKIQSGRARTLAGRQLQDFKKEVTRVDELAHRTPFKTRIASGSE